MGQSIIGYEFLVRQQWRAPEVILRLSQIGDVDDAAFQGSAAGMALAQSQVGVL